MTNTLAKNSAFFLILGSALLFINGCAADSGGKAAMKIGMHIDAVLEFAIEYPLAWTKDRRLAYGSKTGEVRWADPGTPSALLRVSSDLLVDPATDAERSLEQALQEYPGLQVQTREQVTLPAGTAWHVSGQTHRLRLELYVMTKGNRSFCIALRAPPEDMDPYLDIMTRVVDSFQVLTRDKS